ncbi:hypothetical protein BgiBS90_038355 [Biomphalaria glabrata]|nr:hypothetical protein BgiBS90_038355 [Biomphalaria glabrata]
MVHTFSFPDIMGSQTPSPGHMATHSFSLISWAVKTPSPGHIATHSFSWISWAVKTPSLGHMATYSPFPISWAVKTFVTSTVYGDTISFSEIMGSKYSVTGPFGHTFSFPDIMGSQDSVTIVLFMATQSPFPRSWIINTPSPGHTLLPRDQWHSRLRH